MRKSYLILLPTFVFLALFTYFPLFRSLRDSFYDFRYTTDQSKPFVGLKNFERLFADDIFWQALLNNIVYILLTVIPSVVLALLLAVALNENKRINRFLRSIFFMPTLLPLVSAATVWIFIFTPNLGLLDYYLSKIFGNMNNNFLGFSDTAIYALAFVGVWKFAGYYMLFFLAGLQTIPDYVREAAVMEGANKYQIFFKVTLPLLRPTINFVLITAIIYGVTQIDHVVVMTNGGPNHSTSVLLHYIQDLALNSHDLGKASAATFVSLIALFIFSVINLRVLEKGTHYEY
ncbi:sugar ABC transporter permease [Pelistega indica]|uniref:Sugar ABC transporter permease n=1 Tax=Pelistega indica TaxID=1414851 RepID=V8FYG5_9BURK|nr:MULTISPECIES: sugar ABC transporter permease [Pelistega]ETD69205.1 sugar ABC transporter permease [Pelistega indica]